MNDELEIDVEAPRALIERRTHPRIQFRVSVEIGSVTSFFGFSTDVSAAGICVVADEELPVDSLVEIEFQLPSEPTLVEVLGEVRWKRRIESDRSIFSYGIEFLDLSKASRRMLAELAQQHAPVVEASPQHDDEA